MADFVSKIKLSPIKTPRLRLRATRYADLIGTANLSELSSDGTPFHQIAMRAVTQGLEKMTVPQYEYWQTINEFSQILAYIVGSDLDWLKEFDFSRELKPDEALRAFELFMDSGDEMEFTAAYISLNSDLLGVPPEKKSEVGSTEGEKADPNSDGDERITKPTFVAALSNELSATI